MFPRVEFTVSVDVPESELKRLKDILNSILRRVGILIDILFIHVVDTHDTVREVLGLNKPALRYVEKPVKLFLDYDTFEPIISVRKDFTTLSDEELTLELAKEIATYNVIVDPYYVERWAIPDTIEKVTPIDAMISTAMIIRLSECLLIERGYSDLIWRDFYNKKKRDIVKIAEGKSNREKVKALQALAWDTPLSFELVGRKDIGDQLFMEVKKMYNILSEFGKSFVEKYDDFRSFTRNNFYFQNIKEYLDLLFSNE